MIGATLHNASFMANLGGNGARAEITTEEGIVRECNKRESAQSALALKIPADARGFSEPFEGVDARLNWLFPKIGGSYVERVVVRPLGR